MVTYLSNERRVAVIVLMFTMSLPSLDQSDTDLYLRHSRKSHVAYTRETVVILRSVKCFNDVNACLFVEARFLYSRKYFLPYSHKT